MSPASIFCTVRGLRSASSARHSCVSAAEIVAENSERTRFCGASGHRKRARSRPAQRAADRLRVKSFQSYAETVGEVDEFRVADLARLAFDPGDRVASDVPSHPLALRRKCRLRQPRR